MHLRTLALAILLASASLPVPAATSVETAFDPTLQQEMDLLFALRTAEPATFAARVRSLESLPPPADTSQREFLRFLMANRAALEGRFADAIGLAEPLADGAREAGLRLRAGAFVVNMMAGTREFEEGLRRLDTLLRRHPVPDPALRDEQRVLWGVANILYHELGQHRLAIEYADRVLAASPSPREECGATIYREMARLGAGDDTQTEADLDQVEALCTRARDNIFGSGFTSLTRARFLRRHQRLDEALAVLEGRRGIIDATRYPRLTSEAHALEAELLLEAGRVDAAERQARHALVLAGATPTSLPVAMAEKVLYEVHRRRGEAGAALEHLQRHVAANRALAEDSHLKERAFRTVQHESLQREQALMLMTERNRVLDLEARVAKAESRNALMLVGLMVGALLALAGWAWRLRRQERRMRVLARTDSLTGLANRMHFTEQAEAALLRSRDSDRPLMLISFDLDHFKRINDRHGHLAGDAVLRSVGEAVRGVPAEGFRRCIGRLGGEEFAVLLEDASPEQARDHAEALRAAIAGARTPLPGGESLSITASFGLSGTDEAGHDLHALLVRSDRALYRAKDAGRDRVVLADRTMATEAA